MNTVYSYKGYEIRKITRIDWCIYKDGHQVMNLNAGSEGRNAFTLKEAKSRIDAQV